MDATEDCDDAELIAVYWELRASNGSLLTCGLYRHARGEDVRVGAPRDPVLRIQLLSGESGEEVAEYWKEQLLAPSSADRPEVDIPLIDRVIDRPAGR